LLVKNTRKTAKALHTEDDLTEKCSSFERPELPYMMTMTIAGTIATNG
jgi:hypothetical protein